jgi:hypothetical protein
VKEIWKTPFIFLFMLLITTVILAALNVCYSWGMYDSATRAFDVSYAVARFPRSIFAILIPAVIISIVLLGMRMARRPFSRFLGLLISLGVSYIVLVNGMLWLRPLAASAAASPATAAQYIRPGTFMRVGPNMLAVGAISGNNLQRILLFDTAKSASRLSVAPAGAASVRAGTLTVSVSGKQSVSGAPDLSWTGVFAPDRFTSIFLRDVDTLTTDFTRLLSASRAGFFAAAFALLFLCTASLALLRLTRWPLANIMLLVIAVRGYFSLYHLLAVTLAPRITAAISDPLLARMFPVGVMAVIGVVLLLVDILFIPADRWTAEEAA